MTERLRLFPAGVPDADIKRYVSPKNCVTYKITEKSEGGWETTSTFSEMPEWNQTACFKVSCEKGRAGQPLSGSDRLKVTAAAVANNGFFQLGETTEMKAPFEHSITMTKKDENTFCMKT